MTQEQQTIDYLTRRLLSALGDDNHRVIINGTEKTVWFSTCPISDFGDEFGKLTEILVIDKDQYSKNLILYFCNEKGVKTSVVVGI